MGIRTPVAGVRGRHDWPLHYVSTKCVIRLGLSIFIDVVFYFKKSQTFI